MFTMRTDSVLHLQVNDDGKRLATVVKTACVQAYSRVDEGKHCFAKQERGCKLEEEEEKERGVVQTLCRM